MWNVVRMPDNKNYLVDLTNSDEGTIGQDGGLFLDGYYSKDTSTQYTFQKPSGSLISYVYGNETTDYYPSNELELSLTSYNGSTTRNELDIYVEGTYNFDYAMQVLEIVNQKRAEHGASSLAMDADLFAGAQLRAMEIAVYFSHTRPNGNNCYSVGEFNGKCFAENIAAGQTPPAAVMNSWMDSAGHEANILNSSYRSIGIGCVEVNGVTYWVQNFGSATATAVNPSGSETLTKRIDIVPENATLSIADTSLKTGETKQLVVRVYNKFSYACCEEVKHLPGMHGESQAFSRDPMAVNVVY